LEKFKVGDRVWVRIPNKPIERKTATVMAVKNGRKTTRYNVEWEVDLAETQDNHSEYLAQEIVLAHP